MQNKQMKIIDEEIKKNMFYQDIPGLSIVITDNNNVLYKKAYGVKNIVTKLPVSEDTIFHMASITKLFVATAIMQLVEKEKIHLDDTIADYIPSLQIMDSRYKNITILQMLSHTSGLPDCQEYGWRQPEFDNHALERYVISLRDIRLLWEPGKRFYYSNIAYEILGYLIEVVTEMEFEGYVQKNILRPLEMNSSTILYRDKTSENIAAPHIKNKDKNVIQSDIYPYNRAHAPSSTLSSNALDMGRWAICNLNLGTLNNIRVLKETSYKKMWHSVMEIKKNQQKMGLGWFISNHRGYYMLGHEGSDVGFRTSFSIMPQKSLAVGVFANLDQASTRRIMRRVFDILLEIEPQNL